VVVVGGERREKKLKKRERVEERETSFIDLHTQKVNMKDRFHICALMGRRRIWAEK
jgi:hypothetical protein